LKDGKKEGRKEGLKEGRVKGRKEWKEGRNGRKEWQEGMEGRKTKVRKGREIGKGERGKTSTKGKRIDGMKEGRKKETKAEE
jgi:hypothetical protein